MDISIKTATAPANIETIERLAKEIWTQHYTPIIGRAQVDYMLGRFQSQSAIRQDIANGCVYFIAYGDGLACGYCAIKPDNGLFLSKLYVMQACRGNGIARAMMRCVHACAEQNHAARIWLTCNKHNHASLCAYRRLGFTQTGACVTDIGGGFVMDDFILEKRLPEAE